MLNKRKEGFSINTKSTKSSKLSKTRNNIKSSAKIDTSIKFNNIQAEEDDKRTYYCSCCGKAYKNQKGNFSVSFSPLFAGNNRYVTVCNSCRDKYYYQLIDFFSGNEEKAIDRICSLFDWYYHDLAVVATRKISEDRSRIGAYPSKMGLPQTKQHGTTYLDTVKDRASTAITSIEEFNGLKDEGNISVSERTFKRWGLGFSDGELAELDRHYKMLKDLQISSDDVVQDIYIRAACEQHIMKIRARETDPDKYIKITGIYNTTLEKAGLKAKANIRDNLNDGAIIVGKWIDDIEKYCPAEYYADKTKYYDFFGIKEYIERFLYRPLKNFLLGTKDKDLEFSITENSDNVENLNIDDIDDIDDNIEDEEVKNE